MKNDNICKMRYSLFVIFLLNFNIHALCVTDTAFNCVDFIRAYDGDTIKVNIKGVHPLIGKRINIRVKGIDTPEIKTKDKCEKTKARSARKLVNNLLRNAKKIEIKAVERDKYFRILGDVYYDGKLLSNVLLKNGLGYKYNGGTKHNIDWCKKVPR
jgi:endonuclease YncB( thermonuclease family)